MSYDDAVLLALELGEHPWSDENLRNLGPYRSARYENVWFVAIADRVGNIRLFDARDAVWYAHWRKTHEYN